MVRAPLLCLSACLLEAVVFLHAPAQAGPPTAVAPVAVTEVSSWTIGPDGVWKVGHWAMVTLELISAAESEGQISIAAPDGEGAMVEYLDSRPVKLTSGGTTRVTRTVKIGRLTGRLEARLDGVVVGRVSLEQHPGLGSEERTLLVLGNDELFSDKLLEKRIAPLVRRQVAPATMPDRPEALAGFEAIWAPIDDMELSADQRSALAQWNRLGGHLIVVAGDQAVARLGAEGKWKGLTPARFEDYAERRFGGSVEQFAASKERLLGFYSTTLDADDPNRQVLATVGVAGKSRPVIARTPHGLGVTTLVGFDIAAAPFDTWDATRTMVERLLTLPGEVRSDSRQTVGRVRYVGYNDLSGQVRSALDSFQALEPTLDAPAAEADGPTHQPAGASEDFEEGGAGASRRGGAVRWISFTVVVVLLAAYAVLLGPGDYFLLKKLRAPEWSWLTMLLLVAGTMAGIVWLRGALKSRQILLNQLDIVDVDVRSGVIRGTAWMQLYSPNATKWDLAVDAIPALRPGALAIDDDGADGAPAGQAAVARQTLKPDPQLVSRRNAGGSEKSGAIALDEGMLFSWQGLPGGALGAMESRSTAGLLSDDYRAPLGFPQMLGVPMRTASTRSLGARWWQQRTFAKPQSALVDIDGVLEGTLTSPLDVDLENCVLFYNTWVHLFDSARVRAGETVTVEDLPVRRDLAWRLNQKKIAHSSDTRYTTTPWDPEVRDIGRIVEMMMFYNLAGGEQYTRLKHVYQGDLDLSAQLRMGRAVLIGRAPSVATPMRVDQQPPDGQRWTYYRVVFPVKSQRVGP